MLSRWLLSKEQEMRSIVGSSSSSGSSSQKRPGRRAVLYELGIEQTVYEWFMEQTVSVDVAHWL